MTLSSILNLMKKRWRLLVIAPLACAAIMAIYSFGFMKDVYTVTTSMYVMAGRASQPVADGEASSNETSLYSDLNASQLITKDVANLLTGSRVKTQTATDLGLRDLSAYKISVDSASDSRVITLNVTGADAAGAVRVANQLTNNVSYLAKDAMGVESVNVLENPVQPDSPSGPNRKLFILIAALAGFFVAVELVFIADALNVRVRSEEALEDVTGLPILARVPMVKEAGDLRV